MTTSQQSTAEKPRLPVAVLSGFLGAGCDEPALRARLDACRLEAALAAAESREWELLTNPLPPLEKTQEPS